MVAAEKGKERTRTDLHFFPRIFGVRKDEPLRVAMGQETRPTGQHFDWKTLADRLTDVYAGERERVLGAAHNRSGLAHLNVSPRRARSSGGAGT